MALVQCDNCLLTYDDTYRLTWCPHDGFDMATVVVRGDGQRTRCTSLEELDAWLRGRAIDAFIALPQSDGANCGRL